jgi:hypothetical protein
MADETASFAIELEDETSGASNAAGASLAALKAKIDAGTEALGEMQRAMRRLQGGGAVNIQTFKELRDRISAQKASLAQAQERYISLGGAFTKTKKGGDEMAAALERLLGQAGRAPGPLGGLVARLAAVKGLVAGGLIVGGILAIAGALLALVAASVAAVAALLRYGVAQADARRSEQLRLEGLVRVRNWYGLAADSAGFLQGAIDKVTASSALGRQQIGGYAEQLYRMGLRAGNLEAALEGVAIVASTQGEAQAALFKQMAAGAARTGGSVRRLADDVKARLGGVARAQLLSLDVQTRKLKENFGALFSGLKIEGLLGALHSVTELFSQNTMTGKALKVVLERLLQPLIGAIERAGPIAKRFFQGLTIGALLLTIAVLRLRNWLRETFGGTDILKGFDAQRVALWAGVAVFGALAGAVLLTAAAFVLAASPFIAAAVWIARFVSTVGEAWQGLKAIDWGELGTAIIDGLVGGISRGVGRVVAAMKGLASDAKAALASVWESKSPSKAFERLGFSAPQGAAKGVDRGAPLLEDAVDSMAAGAHEGPALALPAPKAAAAGGTGAGARTGPLVVVTIQELNVHAKSSEPRDLVDAIRPELERVFEGIAIQIGAFVPEGGT